MDEYINKKEIIRHLCLTTGCSYHDVIIGTIMDFPAADVQLMKHGRWIDSTFYDPCEKSWEQDFEFECSNCGHKIYNKPNDNNLFCGHCSARMDLKDDDAK